MKTISTFFLSTLLAVPLFAQYQFDKRVHSVTPASGPVGGGTTVTIVGELNFIVPDPCGAPVVYIGGIQAPVASYDDTTIVVTTPPYTSGTFDVIVERCGNRGAMKNAFTFTNDGRTWEKVLLPVYLQNDLPGAFGSIWRTTLTAFNNGNDARIRGRSDRNPEQISYGPFAPSINSDQHQPGRIIYVAPSFSSKFVRFNLRVRDLSLEASTLGTELRTVHEDDAFGPVESFALWNVPLGEPYRQKLRVYRMDTGQPQTINIHFDEDGKDIPLLLSVKTSQEPATGDFQYYPGYYEVDLDRLPELAGHKQTTITISVPYGRYWGYVSVTNNITQQITTVTP